MQIESLETRVQFDTVLHSSVDISDFVHLAANFNNPGSWGAINNEPNIGAFLDFASNFSHLSGNFGQVYEPNPDLNGDLRVDLADFGHFCETAVDSIANNLIRNSAGPGDSDGNGRINKFDIRSLGASFNSYGDWQNGDFTMNRRVNIQDFALAAANVLAK